MTISKEETMQVIPKLNYALGYVHGVYLTYLMTRAKDGIELDLKKLSATLGLPKISLYHAHVEMLNMCLLYSTRKFAENSNDSACVLRYTVKVNYLLVQKLISKIMQIPTELIRPCTRAEQRRMFIKKLIEEEY